MKPLEGAGADRVIVASVLLPPGTMAGAIIRLISVGRFAGSMLRGEITVTPTALAEMSTVCEELTASVETVNGAELCPPEIPAVAGTEAITELLERRKTITPPGGATSDNVIVPNTGRPPVTPPVAN